MAATLRLSEKGRKKADSERKKRGFNQLADKLFRKDYYLRRFWRRIPIDRDVFVEICKNIGVNWEEVIDNSSCQQTHEIQWFAYDNVWVGREELVTELSEKIQGSCRLLVLLGMSGIGKTALAERLVVELQENGLYKDSTKFQQENFETDPQAYDFVSVATRWLEKWGKLISGEEPKHPKQLLTQLVQSLKNNSYLIIIDSLENILQGNEEEGWTDFKDEWWGKFFESFLALDFCPSRIILTSQDLPHSIPQRYKNFFHCQVLSGLTAFEQLALFDKIGLELNPENQLYLERIGAAYEGHPLALRVIGGEIGDRPFYGNIVAYWNKYGSEIEEVEQAIAEAQNLGKLASADDNWKLDRYTRLLQKNVRLRLEKTFYRLKQDSLNAYLLLCEGSIYRCGVLEKFWLSHLEDWDCDPEEQELALLVLRDRYLVEDIVESDQLKVRQHNLIRSVALDHLKQLDNEDQ